MIIVGKTKRKEMEQIIYVHTLKMKMINFCVKLFWKCIWCKTMVPVVFWMYPIKPMIDWLFIDHRDRDYWVVYVLHQRIFGVRMVSTRLDCAAPVQSPHTFLDRKLVCCTEIPNQKKTRKYKMSNTNAVLNDWVKSIYMIPTFFTIVFLSVCLSWWFTYWWCIGCFHGINVTIKIHTRWTFLHMDLFKILFRSRVMNWIRMYGVEIFLPSVVLQWNDELYRMGKFPTSYVDGFERISPSGFEYGIAWCGGMVRMDKRPYHRNQLPSLTCFFLLLLTAVWIQSFHSYKCVGEI